MNSKKHLFSSITIYFFCYLLSACSLRPVYGDKITTNISYLDSIEIASIDSVEGSELIHHLRTIFPIHNQPKYLLKIKLNNQISPLAIQKNASILRNTISQMVEYQLLDKDNNVNLTQGRFKHFTSYPLTFSPYASCVEEEEALKNLSRQAAEDIRTRLLLYFSKNSNL